MVLGKKDIQEMFLSAAAVWQENAARLSEIDSRFGDGDHGVTIGKIAQLIKERTANLNNESIQDFLSSLGDAVLGVNGGSAGPLYGTMIGGFAANLQDETEIDAKTLKLMFTGALDELSELTTAKAGDKTMMDALIPAVNAAQGAPEDIPAILQAAAAAARKGAEDSAGFIAKFGRARSYKEQTIGTPDAGAVSTALFFEGLAAGIQSHE